MCKNMYYNKTWVSLTHYLRSIFLLNSLLLNIGAQAASETYQEKCYTLSMNPSRKRPSKFEHVPLKVTLHRKL